MNLSSVVDALTRARVAVARQQPTAQVGSGLEDPYPRGLKAWAAVARGSLSCQHRVVNLEALKKDWRGYERFVAGLYAGADRVTVEHNVTLTDKDGSSRQLDCLVTVTFGAHTFRVVVECKAGNGPVERADVDELLVTREKVNASSAVVFACGEFQSGAINTASKNGIKLFHVREPLPGAWWPAAPTRALVQVWSIRLQDHLALPWEKIGVGTPDGVEWPKGIKAPTVSFAPCRSSTKVLGRDDDLEHMIETAARNNVAHSSSPRVGVIDGGRDCVAHFTVRCDVKFLSPIVIQEREDPPTFLQIPELSVRAAVRIEQRTLSWKSRVELDAALLVNEVTERKTYQVGRAVRDAPWVWMEPRGVPLGAGVGTDRRLVVTSQETFRAEIFDRPWDTFEKINTYDVASVPASKTLQGVLDLLGSNVPDPSPPDRR